jgi:drug/metabolite transporter (DMT)-like permease
MKKIENWLIWPVLLLLFYSASKHSDTASDIILNDTFYVISNASISGWFALWLVIVIILFKIIRRRHLLVNQILAFTYITLTLLLFGFYLLISFVGGGPKASGFSDSELDAWIFYNQLRIVTACCFFLTQVIFLIYFVVQLKKQPAITRAKNG